MIHIKAGAYFEYLDIARSKKMLMLVGDGIQNTYIKGNRSVGGGWTTFRSSTVGEFSIFSLSLCVCSSVIFLFPLFSVILEEIFYSHGHGVIPVRSDHPILQFPKSHLDCQSRTQIENLPRILLTMINMTFGRGFKGGLAMPK